MAASEVGEYLLASHVGFKLGLVGWDPGVLTGDGAALDSGMHTTLSFLRILMQHSMFPF